MKKLTTSVEQSCSKINLFACRPSPQSVSGEASIELTERVRYDRHLLDRPGKTIWPSIRGEVTRIQSFNRYCEKHKKHIMNTFGLR